MTQMRTTMAIVKHAVPGAVDFRAGAASVAEAVGGVPVAEWCTKRRGGGRPPFELKMDWQRRSVT